MIASTERTSLLEKLQSLAPVGVIRNDAESYPAFGVLRGNRYYIAVHVGKRGATFFTENMDLLAELTSAGVTSEKIEPNSGRNHLRYRFPDLTVEDVASHPGEFRQLIQDSVSIKEN